MAKTKKEMEQFLIEEYENQSQANRGGSGSFKIILVTLMIICMTGAVLLSRVDVSGLNARRYLKKMIMKFRLTSHIIT